MTLDRVFTAHMSGNTVGLVVHIATRNGPEVAKRAAVIVDFLVGLAVGAVAATVAHRRGARGGFASALSIEAGLLVALLVASEVVAGGGPVPSSATGYFALLALPAAAMGIQSATLRRVEPAHVRTTYMTGVLTRLVENAVAWAMRPRGPRGAEEGAAAGRRVLVLASIWIAYATGGVASALLELRFAMRAYGLPLALLVVAIVLDRALARAGVAAAGPEEG
jgi:uncharacterized membrane protein YoaK (UPF0700 family)